MVQTNGGGEATGPSVTIVFLVYNRRHELRESLRRMLVDSDFDSDLVDVIVVDNASTDGSGQMVREDFPQVRLIRREENVGVSAWNDGFAIARSDYVLALDDDCFLPADGLRRAIAAAVEHDADLVSFRVVSTEDPEWVFTDRYRTGLFSFWGCAVLMRRVVLSELGGFDPEIFVWAHELEFMLRFYDRGFRHLHFPEVTAHHMKPAPTPGPIDERAYRINARHWGYIVAKLLHRRDASEALIALIARDFRDGLRRDRAAFKALPDTARGFLQGLRRRQPVANSEVSRFYRRNFETFASPWWFSRPAGELIRALPREIADGTFTSNTRPEMGKYVEFYDKRARLYPAETQTLDFADAGGKPRLGQGDSVGTAS